MFFAIFGFFKKKLYQNMGQNLGSNTIQQKSFLKDIMYSNACM